MAIFEALTKTLYYTKVGPANPEHIALASLQEREGFGTGIDPQELPEVLQYVASHGHVWLQSIEGKRKDRCTGVIEFLPLPEALKFKPDEIKTELDINASPLTMITRDQEKNFEAPRKFADDDEIIYHHGISMSRRGKGYGTLLLDHALRKTPGVLDKFIPCYIDAAQMNETTGALEPAANERSYTVHMKAGFVLAGVVEPPVYDDSITYYAVVRPADSRQFKYGTARRVLNFKNPDVNGTINNVRELITSGFVGVSYDRKAHEMTFAKLR